MSNSKGFQGHFLQQYSEFNRGHSHKNNTLIIYYWAKVYCLAKLMLGHDRTWLHVD